MGDIENKIGRNIDFDKDSIQDGFLTSSGRFVDRKEAIDIASRARQLEPNLQINPDIGLIKENLKPMKVIDVEPSPLEGISDSPQWPKAFDELISTNLEEVKPSENVEDRGDYDIFDKFKYHPAFDELKKAAIGEIRKDTTSVLGHKLVREDTQRRIDEGADRTKLRKYGMKRNKELTNEASLARWKKWLEEGK